MTNAKETHQHDFIVVGSGAGGGPLAANLSREGYSVLLIEAGGDEINDNYSVPAFHAKSTEDPLYSWEFFVKHYSRNPERDPKYHEKDDCLPESPGIFYPRASGLGGCTTHHAMITVYPHESDWNFIAEQVDDESWNAENMRQYFDRFERPQYGDSSALLKLLNSKEILKDFLKRFTSKQLAKEGSGWLSLTQADPKLLLLDRKGVLKVVTAAIRTAWNHGLRAMPDLNPNHPSVAADNLEGFNIIPISVDNGNRTGARERVLKTLEKLEKQSKQGKKTGRLDLVTNTFATNVVFADDNPKRAVGVRCVPGESLYGARHHERKAGQPEQPIVYLAQKEVILCGGAFNTPQLLMLSGIGSREELKRHEIDVRVESPGVGKNLQDRYEVGVVATAGNDFKLLEKATFKGRKSPTDPDPDSVFTEWREKGKGIYATNGSVVGIIKRSSTQSKTDPPDLYIFGVPGLFQGYEIGYSEESIRSKNYFTWAVLKGHTDNVSGQVSLKSNNPFDTPDIHFSYFEESTQSDTKDVQSVVDGIEFVQEIYQRLEEDGVITEQVAPRPGENLHKFVRDNAWGHHASCTCKIGAANDPEAVLDKDFQVRGVENLRVVDASVFPRIPGLFILASVYMISEKASDVIINKYNKSVR